MNEHCYENKGGKIQQHKRQHYCEKFHINKEFFPSRIVPDKYILSIFMPTANIFPLS